MESRYRMGKDLRSCAAPCRPRLNLPTSRRPVIDRAGALAVIVEPLQVLDDPPGVADRLPADLEHGHDGLARQRLHLVALAAPPRHPPLVGLDPAPGQLPRHRAA